MGYILVLLVIILMLLCQIVIPITGFVVFYLVDVMTPYVLAFGFLAVAVYAVAIYKHRGN